jgi:hypothetical protein
MQTMFITLNKGKLKIASGAQITGISNSKPAADKTSSGKKYVKRSSHA